MINKIIQGDCLQVMKDIPDKSLDMICCDLPYGVTRNKWDSVIPFVPLWTQYERIIKDNGAIVLFGQDKFTAKVMLSNEKLHRYNIIWEKTSPTGFLNAKRMPLRSHEDIMVFYKKLPIYNPQKTIRHKRKVSTAKHKRNSLKTTNYGKHDLKTYDSTERYPKSVWKFKTDKQKKALHPTQKPVGLIVELILTYTNKGAIVLDNCIGSGTTACACVITERDFIGIETEKKNIDVANKRVRDAIENITQH